MRKFVKEMRIVGELLAESVSFAYFSIKSDKLRTFLSLSGVTVGIFSVVAVFCTVDSLQDNIMEGIKSFGSDVVYVDRFPLSQGDGEEEPEWWKYLQRPEISEDDYRFVSRNASLAGSIVYVTMGSGSISFGRRSYGNAYLLATTDGLEGVMEFEIMEGRSFTGIEARGGSSVAVLGHEVAVSLFGDRNPVGRKIRVCGSNATVVGVLAGQGESMASFIDTDNAVILPLQYGKAVMTSSWNSGMIMASPAEGVPRQEFLDELRLLLRSNRGLSPSESDDFAINEMTFLLSMLDSVFSGISRAGWIIGAFSLVIGGFGIANIMFVSVSERTRQTGIQKALGARKYAIISQFLAESSFLSVAGGVTGVLLVLLASVPVNLLSGQFRITVSAGNAFSGILVSAVLGIVSGLVPAWKAASADPVRSINS